MTTSPCDFITETTQRITSELDSFIDKVDRTSGVVNNIFNEASTFMGSSEDLIPTDFPELTDIQSILSDIAFICPNIEATDITAFKDRLQESYRSILRSALRDPLRALSGIQDNLLRQFDTQKIQDKMDDLSGYLQCIESICDGLAGIFPGMGDTSGEIVNYFNTGLRIGPAGVPEILTTDQQTAVSIFNVKVTNVQSYITELGSL